MTGHSDTLAPLEAVDVRTASLLTSLSEFAIRDAISRGQLAARQGEGRRLVILTADLRVWFASLPVVQPAD